jgi:hypothetical protein
MATKATKTTLKSFVKKNAGSLFINTRTSFDSMVDGCTETKDKGFRPAEETSRNTENTLGVNGIWLVGRSNDYINHFSKDGFTGLEVYNSCGHFFVATKD